MRLVAVMIILCSIIGIWIDLNLTRILKTLSILLWLNVLLFNQNETYRNFSFLSVVQAISNKVEENLKVPALVSVNIGEIVL